MRLALVQINPTVGDVEGNAALIAAAAEGARRAGAELAVFPELAICGYPPKDLLLHETFLERCRAAAEGLARDHSAGMTIVFGCPLARAGGRIANALVAARDGKIVAEYDKRLLPTYDVFDEDRYFTPGSAAVVIGVPTAGGEVRVGLSVCEDLWKGFDAGFSSRYAASEDPVPALVAAGARVIVNPSASPFVLGKGRRHREILASHATRHGVYVAAVNQVGGNDDLIFDGHAAVIDPAGRLVAAGPGFETAMVVCEIPAAGAAAAADPLLGAADEELAYRALVLGIRDYCGKTGFKTAIVGLSGGIDSALTGVLAAAALGAGNVTGVAMPGPYSSDHALADARESAARLGLRFTVLAINDAMAGARAGIDGCFASLALRRLGETLPDLTEENLQSRLRGTMLMALSNRSGAIVLTTGNKSELAVGYCTLYGDMNGGLAVLSDVSKQLVYRLARWINAHAARLGFAGPPIPQRSIDKAPSAELRPDQTDQDSLPPYDVLDRIIELFVEQRLTPGTIVGRTGFAAAEVERVCRMIDLAEYKRRQAATGLKITTVAFGPGRRVPIAQRWRFPGAK